MFQVYHSNSLLVLKDLLTELIRRDPISDPFVAEQILVQSPGMAQWLKLELADKSGIAASIDFPLPASFLWKHFSEVLPDVPERSAYNKEAMSWKLMAVLPAMLKQPVFSALQQYLADDDDRFRLYQLCNKIADIYDQYLVYRPDWIEDWEQGGDIAAARHPWQPVLWRELKSYTEDLQQSHWHRANMFSAFVDGLKNPSAAEKLPRRLFVFGISALPQNYVHALQALGKRIDVHLMVMNPCRYYWGDILDQSQIARLNRRWFSKPDLDFSDYAEGNPLLASMGKLGRDYLYQLQDNALDEIDAYADPERGSLLSAIQQDILDLENPTRLPEQIDNSHGKHRLDREDRSIELHSCHSALREIEVLHDQLLDMFEKNPLLKPRDVIVMMPDVAAYAPYIEAVFANAPAERYIPYSISDRSNRQENPLLLSFEKILKLNSSRFTVSDVLELLEVPAVMRRVGLDEKSFQKLRFWVDQVNIRWGMDSEQRSIWELPLFEQNSWRFGIKRMLVGYALGEGSEYWQGVAPYTEIEGLESELLGKLAGFIDLLDETRLHFTQDHEFSTWIEVINQILENYFTADEQDEISLNTIRKTLQGLQEQLKDANYSQALSPSVIAHYLIDGINQQRSSQRFMVGSVNFCTLMPMRSIPFSVVCLLGMNDGTYPRSIPPVGFDLMTDYPRRGDRSRRDDDRYLFMEALLSAQEKLYISYIGRSIRDNNEKIPSVLVSELLDYAEQGYVLEGDEELSCSNSGEKLRAHIKTQHPLVAFSPEYFKSAGDYFSFASEWLPAAQAESRAAEVFLTEDLTSEALPELELKQLISFLRDPCRSFFNNRLKVYFGNSEIEAQDEEPFSLDNLSSYLLKQRYLQSALQDRDLERLDKAILAEGRLPLARAGELNLNKLRHDSLELAEKLKPLSEGTPQRIEINLSIGEVKLQGWLDSCYPDHLLRYRPAQVNARDRLSTWVEHLALCASNQACRNTVYRGLSGKVFYKAVPAEKATELLADLIRFYQQGQTAPQAFDAGSAHKYFEQQAKDPDKVMSALENQFYGSAYSNGLQDNPYLRRAFSDFEPFVTQFIPLAERIYEPLLSCVEEGKDD
ncbi:exodeoxyribonuclease V subunit gamma [Neptuniibacter caesariensis]|uniref:RecBCD enzyme subunit RecC n=1 Tax=Neptuniibacter caesariensis TaxID=207954 RepID=A0A7U8C3Q8_NEPCE|nr:exodeoxyribonuclease V subunit gamma [Neptuniibacter caesariensis]EAR60948.1 exodeoxyribonuclease V, 125 kDa subunit [Oceanospirillum sp. MED92] [Neptuniibacter caesariensis]